MRYLVVSDVHSNAPALEAVLNAAPEFDALLCLGDIVGYGPDPNTCVARLRDHELVSISGNHDAGALGQADLSIFNHDARKALIWTQQELARRHQQFLAGLAPHMALTDDILLCHGSPRDPVWDYLVELTTAAQCFREYDFQTLLVGHSHLPLAFEWREDLERARPLRVEVDGRVQLAGRRMILNPGSVGQPRDGNPKAAYAVLDTGAMTWTFGRTAYAVKITQERMRAQKLPQRLIDRLEIGR